MKRFSVDGLREKYGIRRQVVTELVRSGFIEPERGERREYRFSFHDVVLLRMAQDLQAAGISARKLTRFLKELARVLPPGSSAGMRVSTAGRELVVRQDGRLRNLQGQLVLEFGMPIEADSGNAVRSLGKKKQDGVRTSAEADADAHADAEAQTTASASSSARNTAATTSGDDFFLAESLMESDPAAAIDCFQQALERHPESRDGWINLTFLLIDAGQKIEAFAACQEALLHCPEVALLHFNFGIVQEEMAHPAQALASYQRALRYDPELADAHFNAARVCEALGREKAAIRHYNAYRRHAGD